MKDLSRVGDYGDRPWRALLLTAKGLSLVATARGELSIHFKWGRRTNRLLLQNYPHLLRHVEMDLGGRGKADWR